MLPNLSRIFLLCLLVVAFEFASGKPQNSNSNFKSADETPSDKQSFVINNNCGIGAVEHEMIADIQAKVQFLAEQSTKAACTDGWVNHRNSCFLIIDIPTLKWSDARRTCQKLGGDLAKITSADEDKFITDLMFKQTTITKSGVWIGLHRKSDRKFHWTDGTPLGSYKPWDSGQPDNYGNSEGCGNKNGSGNGRGKWNDYLCSLSQSWYNIAPVILCQKSSK